MIRRRLFALALLSLASVPASAAVPAPPAGDARAFVDSVAARYLRLAQYRFEGVVHATAAGPGLPAQPPLEMSFVYAAVRPSRLHNDTRNPYMSSTVVADGESLWIHAPGLQQYSVQRAPSYVPGTPANATARSFDAVLFLAEGLTNRLASARFLGADTVRTAAGAVPCRIVELTYEADTAQSQSRPLPRVLWIDESRGLLLRDSTTTELSHPQYGEVRQAQSARYLVADLSVPADSLFHFAPPAGTRRVRRIGQQPEASDHAGEPAKDFTLAVLDGKGRKVSLASLRGKVVVLDFWATWCGPCRRWMPVVAKLEKETAGKDVKFFAVNLHEPLADVRAYVKAQKIDVPVLLDVDGAVGTAYGARSIPLTVIVGRDGKIVTSLVGVHPEEDLRDALRDAGVAGL